MSLPAAPPDAYAEDIELQMERERLAMVFERSASSNSLSVPMGGAVVWALWGTVAGGVLFGWLAAKALTSLAREWVAYRYRRSGGEVHWGHPYRLALAADGLVWGLLTPLAMLVSDPVYAVVMTATVIGVAAVGLVVLPMHLRYLAAFALPTMLPGLPFLVVQGTNVSIYLAIGMLVFLVLLLVEGERSATHTQAMLRIRFRMDALAQERQAALEAVERASHAKSRFVSTMSHEIRTPLNGVLGMTELLRHTELSADQARYTHAIATAGGALHSLLSDILDLAKIEEGRVLLERVAFHPQQLLSDLAAGYADLARARGNELQVGIELDPSEKLLGDPTRIRQVVSNLLGNANKFTERGTLTLSAALRVDSEGATRLAVSVADTGVGIPPEALPRLFERFEQADASTTRRFGGTGLGLSISKHLVELMGGTIAVVSEPGSGSRFSFELPLERAPASAVAPVGELAPPRLDGVSVLVAEDNAINRMVVAALLKRLGANVTLVDDGAQALAALGVHDAPFDLLLLDCQMPVMDGYETSRRVRALPGRVRSIPIVALTANAMAEDRRACLDAGMDDYIVKPVGSSQLAAVLNKYTVGLGTPAN